MIQLSVKTKYGLLALMGLARRYDTGPVQSRIIGVDNAIPQAYLEQVLLHLKKGGFCQSSRGKNGGYWLATSPQCITIVEVIRYLEGPVASSVDEHEIIADFWQRLHDAVSDVVADTLADWLVRYPGKKPLVYTI